MNEPEKMHELIQQVMAENEELFERLSSDYESGTPYRDKACYWCKGIGILQSDEECPCTYNSCQCKFCKEGDK